MRAMQYRHFGGPDQIMAAEVPTPRPTATQLLVKVAGTSVNPVDWKLRRTQGLLYRPVPFPSIPGADISGKVVEVGGQVTRFKPGDRLFAMASVRFGAACAEYAVVEEQAAAQAPANLPLAEAAALPLAGLTALQSLRDLGGIAAGQHVLIGGAAGGVGHFAVQIAKHHGAHVTAVCSGKHAEFVRGLGADVVIDYTLRKELTVERPYDLVLDLIVRAPLRDFFAVMAPAGVVVSTLPTFSRVSTALLLPFVSRRRVRFTMVKARAADLDQLRMLCEAGKLRPVIDRTFALAELAAAHAYSQQGHAAGKILVTVK
ncbi:MAG: NAD(P)-dependent alcohol dehydrogenase [Gammaproteobacteria bacterium]|nr:NAD(P)-dependent alcohol dehydrogenase [Gammaproteobacteria bacterium]MDH3370347.1 NAD(P)-dependent alcohol dehydrogenase [Gammaproteobacteria bacterium]MDH3406970.1 NAD(P)-dependent alcohol dehydrogenase [Gammaproteobacteria bacterium]MDH3563287.1 NAD(P)-dependent alcohol dehydrogenase [Gammaproteobacteria bacterium]